jgi:hypothetical protein
MKERMNIDSNFWSQNIKGVRERKCMWKIEVRQSHSTLEERRLQMEEGQSEKEKVCSEPNSLYERVQGCRL